jgi:hypothetical protein
VVRLVVASCLICLAGVVAGSASLSRAAGFSQIFPTLAVTLTREWTAAAGLRLTGGLLGSVPGGGPRSWIRQASFRVTDLVLVS